MTLEDLHLHGLTCIFLASKIEDYDAISIQ